MDNGQNKLIVMIAVGIVGAVAGQHFLKPTAPPIQQAGPWGPGYPVQQPLAYLPPGYAPPHYVPQPGYAQPPQYLPVDSQRQLEHRPAIGQYAPEPQPRIAAIQPNQFPQDFHGESELRQNSVTPIPTDRGNGSVQPASGAALPLPPIPLVLAAEPMPRLKIESIENDSVTWKGDNIPLADRTIKLEVTISQPQDADTVFDFVQIGPTTSVLSSVKLAKGESSGIFSVTVPGSVKGRITIGIQANGVTISPKTAILPDDTMKLTVAASNNIVLAPAVFVSPIYSYGGYLNLAGKTSPGATIQFSMLDTTTRLGTPPDPLTLNFDRTNADSAGNWSHELVMPVKSDMTSGRLLVRSELAPDQISPPQSIQFTSVKPIKLSDRDVEVTKVQQGPDSTEVTGSFAKSSPIKVTGRLLRTVPEGQVVLLVNGEPQKLIPPLAASTSPFDFAPLSPQDGSLKLAVAVYQGKTQLAISEKQREIVFRTSGPRPVSIFPKNLDQTPNANVLQIKFNDENPINPSTVEIASSGDSTNKNRFTLRSTRGAVLVPISATLDPGKNVVELRYSDIPPETYRLTITKDVADVFGNLLLADSTQPARDHSEFVITRSGTPELAVPDVPLSPTPGLKGIQAEYVPYREYTKPRTNPVGFNPSDKVVTRVARLYYYRDAHRVVQLINRKASSYNRQAVDMQQQLADNARRDAENASEERKLAEQSAIRAAQKTRAAETALVQFQQALARAREQKQATETALATETEKHDQLVVSQQSARTLRMNRERQAGLDPATATEDEVAAARKAEAEADNAVQQSTRRITKLQSDQTDASSQIVAMEGHVTSLMGEVQTSRNDEATQRESMDKKQFTEDRTRADLFRREVAAAHADPDTFAPGKPDSQDPIEQVSLSVIGEGLIQLRGPLKGVNLARTLINQIDAPVGQVKVAIHTVQVNGEHAKRMEPVIGRIQRYIDHSRFLTTQSSQMLRNAVTLVASRRADQAMLLCETNSQVERDQKYIEAFFGREFLAELKTLDSEFLHTGNKLLSLHSMDSTSLANALFLLSLAKNHVRQEILAEFERMVTCQLPNDEMEYFTASNEKYKFGPIFHKQKFVFLGHNARFVSLRGFFNAEQVGSDTITPMQREFIRLAQIFKSRLVTEIELQQRVMERALIEDRFANFADEMTRAEKEENAAREQLRRSQAKLGEHQQAVLVLAQRIRGISDTFVVNSTKSIQWSRIYAETEVKLEERSVPFKIMDKVVDLRNGDKSSEGLDALRWAFRQGREWAEKNAELYRNVNFLESQQREMDARMTVFGSLPPLIDDKKTVEEIRTAIKKLKVVLDQDLHLLEHVGKEAQRISNLMQDVVEEVFKPTPDAHRFYSKWIMAKTAILGYTKGESADFAKDLVPRADAALNDLIATQASIAIASRLAESSRRPLDHKKFLDMLIDDVEDKFIELMEGTRAHTANIDNYLSRLGQALEDDFNTQFYFPAFKGIREASRFWDVNLGQIETTTILTNNRMLAKVSPQATMEFDLPKRDILIQEAFQSAQAAYDDYGALLGDPTFLALTKMYRGQPTSAMFGSEALTPVTRNVLPGLPSSTDERLVAQNRAVAPDFPSALESLIPDPAIYKFETGTGYEIRPVIQPDGQAVVFHFNYMYTTNVREPVRADEKHLGRVKRHFIDTDVQTGNYEMREVSKYQVALKASRTSRGVPLLEDIPGAGILFRPLPSQESSIQENIILAQSVIFPTLFDLMGLRWAPAVADLDSLRLQEADFVTRSRQRGLRERVFDYSSQQVDDFLRIPQSERRPDVYRSQETTPYVHPNGYAGPGLGLKDGVLREGYAPEMTRPQSRYAPGANPEGAIPGSMRGGMLQEGILLPPPGAIDPHRGHQEGPASGPRPISTESRPNGPSRPSGSDVPMGPADHPPLNGTPMSPSGEARLNERAVPSPRTGSRLRPPAAQTRTTPDERSPVQLQSYTTESPAATKPNGPASAPKGSRPVPSPAGSPPRLLPQGTPTPQRVPAGAGSQKPEARKAVPLTSQTGFSPAPARPQIQSSGDVKPKGTTPTAPIVQVSGSDASNLESKSTAKKKTSLWPRKP
jgi:hypothetical protein